MTERSLGWRLQAVLAGTAAVYLVLAAVGLFFFIYKTLVLPVFLVYALALPHAKRAEYLRAWVPFLAATVLFDLLRGWIFVAVQAGYRPVLWVYVIRWESALFGVPALPLLFRAHPAWADALAFVFHAAHFVYFLLIATLVYHVDPARGRWLQRALLVTMGMGLVGYALAPTAPPWLAAEQGLLPPIGHRVVAFYQQYVGSQLHQAFDTNLVAAMPSLHTAFPVACAVVGARTFTRPVAVLLWLWVVCLSASIIYLGEHYGVDLLAGALVAVVAVRVTR